jgi:Tfp pilus assembly protein PilF
VRLPSRESQPGRARRTLRLGLAGLIAAAVIGAFTPALHAGFVYWDDDKNFLDNARWRGLSLEHLRWMATTFHGGPYQPLSWLTLGIDHALWGMDPRGYHLTNVLLHAIGAVAFFRLALRLLPLCTPKLEGKTLTWASASSALLFAVHPLRVESVAWITERRDVLSGIFFTLSILAYLRSATDPEPSGRRGAYAASLACLLLCLLAKASGIVVPVVLLLLDRWPLRRPLQVALLGKIPFVLLAIPFAWLAWRGQASLSHEMPTLGEHGVAERLAQAAYSAVFYPVKTLLPVDLAPIYELPASLDPLAPRFLAAIVVAAAATALLFAMRRSIPAVWSAWASFLVIVAPVSGLVQVGPQLVADRYSYLACMPFALLAAGALFSRLRRAAPVASLAAVAVLGVLTWRQARLWQDTETLFRRALEVDAQSYIAHDVVGRMATMRGRKDEAAAHYRAAIAIAPGQPIPHNNLGLLLLEENKLDEAVGQFREALRARPDYLRARGNLGVALFSQGKVAEAETELREAVRGWPDDPGARVNLGNVLLVQDRPADAAQQYEAALALQARSVEAHQGLAQAYSKLGRAELAAEHLRRALELRSP